MIVVGIDGSDASKEAFRWALEEARLRRSRLQAVYAWLPPQIVGRGYIPLELIDPDVLRQLAQERLDGFVDEVAQSSDLEIESVAVEGRPRRCW